MYFLRSYEQKHAGGEVKICFDNTISTFNRKTVFFELLQEDPENPLMDEQTQFSDLEGLSPEEFYEMKVQDILDIIHVVRGHITKARQIQVINKIKTMWRAINSGFFQDMLRSFEARDRNLGELTNTRVFYISIFIIVLMLSVGALQVFMIRNLFETNPKSRKIWEKLGKYIGQ